MREDPVIAHDMASGDGLVVVRLRSPGDAVRRCTEPDRNLTERLGGRTWVPRQFVIKYVIRLQIRDGYHFLHRFQTGHRRFELGLYSLFIRYYAQYPSGMGPRKSGNAPALAHAETI